METGFTDSVLTANKTQMCLTMGVAERSKLQLSSLIHTTCFFLRKSLFCLSLNFLTFPESKPQSFLNVFLTFAEINWLEWFTLSLILLYT